MGGNWVAAMGAGAASALPRVKTSTPGRIPAVTPRNNVQPATATARKRTGALIARAPREHVGGLVPADRAAAEVQGNGAKRGQNGDEIADKQARHGQQALLQAVDGRGEARAHEDSP